MNDTVVTDLEGLPKEIRKILKEYSKDTRYKVSDAVVEVAKESRKLVKDKAPVGRRKGKYKRAIRVRKEEQMESTSAQIYAGNHEYSLTHLLEHGHKLWNRPSKPTKAFVHWKTGEEYAKKELPKRIIEKLEND